MEVEGLAVQDYAEEAGITRNNANAGIFRAREALWKEVQKWCGTCATHRCVDRACGPPVCGGAAGHPANRWPSSSASMGVATPIAPRTTMHRVALLASVSAWLSLAAGCALSHERAADASSDGSSARSDRECTRSVVEGSSLSPEQRAGLVQRLHHEVSHLAGAVAGIAAGTLPPEHEWAFDEDDGSMVVVGDLEMRDDEVALVAEISFTHWTGRHGGWGYSALEGTACVTIVAPHVPNPDSPLLTVDAVVHLVADGPLLGSPRANVHYVASGSSIEGTVAGEPIGDGD